MNPDNIYEVQLSLVRKIEDLLSRPSIPVGRQLIDQTFNKKRDKQTADDLSTTLLYLLYTNKVKREQTEDGVPKFWLASRETPTDVNGREITLVGGLSRQFHYRLIDGNQCVETNVVGVGDSVVKREPPPIKTLMPVSQNKETQDQLAAVMLQTGTPDQVREALGYASRPTLIEEMRAAAAAVDADDEEEDNGSGQDDENTLPSSPPGIADPVSFLHARMSALEGYRLDDQLVIAVSFWQKPVKEEDLIEFFMTKLMAKMGTLKLRLAHVVKVRQELTRTERADGVYYSVGPKTATLKQRPKTAAYKPRATQRVVELSSAPPTGAAIKIMSDPLPAAKDLLQPTVSTLTECPLAPTIDKAIEITEDSKVMYLVDDTGGMSISISGVNILSFTPGAAAKLVQFSSNVKGLYDL